jgi:Arc/MetJ-type ribon-helix-helix transcriptional regulator
MYVYTVRCYDRRMVRTQVHLDEEDIERLDTVAKRTGASRSELIRRAIRAQYGEPNALSRDERRERLLALAGAWKDRPYTGEEYVRAIRSGDMNANLRRLEGE